MSIHEKNMAGLKFHLKDALRCYEAKTGIHMTYESLAISTGISIDTIKSMATRDDYNSSLKNIALICEAIHCNPIEYLDWVNPKDE